MSDNKEKEVNGTKTEDTKPEKEEKKDVSKTSKEKKSKTSGEIKKLEEELAKQKELLMRTAAEFDNYKKRTEREKTKTAEYSKALVIKQLLPVIDNAGRALSSDPSSPDFVKGIEMIVKQLSGIVETLGLIELAEVGDTFNPEIHEAVMHTEDETKGENEIIQVLQQGYKIGDTVIRTAMVQVAN